MLSTWEQFYDKNELKMPEPSCIFFEEGYINLLERLATIKKVESYVFVTSSICSTVVSSLRYQGFSSRSVLVASIGICVLPVPCLHKQGGNGDVSLHSGQGCKPTALSFFVNFRFTFEHALSKDILY